MGPFLFTPQLAERSSPSRVRCAAQNQRALDCSGPFYGLTVMKEREPPISDSNTCASRWSGMRHSGWGIFQPELTGRPWAILGAGIFKREPC